MALTEEQQRQWQDKGYLLLPGLYSADRIDQLNKLIDQMWKKRKKLDERYVIDIFVGSDEEQRVYFCDAPSAARNKPYKLNDLYLSSDEVRDMVAGDALAPVLNELLSGFPMICNSLNFEFGSQQRYHFDTFYMPSPTPNKMVASWIALEDATELNGPLSYYPGSHKIPPYKFSNGTTVIIPEEFPAFRKYMDEQLAEYQLEPETLLANKGDVLIWHSQLFHGGSEILDKSKTRKSLVTHYFTREDFPDLEPPLITEQSCYMARNAQPVGYEYVAKKSWLQNLFG
ncbi:MAG: phytanoyl-CoA dioxygenase family protein [Pseudomonadota bacterium]